jgi:hypothetical protein
MPDGLGPSLAALHARFLSILPRIERHGCIYFRAVRCPHQRADHIAERVALAWTWFGRQARQGTNASRFPTTLACSAARAVQCGRLCDQERAPDGLSPLDPPRRHFAVGKLPDFETLSDHPSSETLPDNTTSPPEETVCFQRDFAAWLASLTERSRDIVEDRGVGEPTRDVADKYDVTPACLAQRRRAFCQDWRAFCHKLSALAVSSALGVA